VAGALAGGLGAAALVAVALAALLFSDATRDLVRTGLTARLDRLAEETEARSTWVAGVDPLDAGHFDVPRRLRLDLATRLPDPIYLVDADGRVRAAFGEEADSAAFSLPPGVRAAMEAGEIDVEVGRGPTWAVAPLLAPDGLVAGALVVQPLAATYAEATAAPRAAFRRAFVWGGVAALALALGLAAALTAPLVRPIRRVTRRVEALGEGDYAARLPVTSHDELGRLAAAVNEMAARVEGSLDALRATDRLRRELVASVGHDLRTPLAALTGYLDEAERLRGEGRDGEADEALATARREAARTARLVADLFELSVLDAAPEGGTEAGRGPLRREPVPVAELLGEAISAHRAGMERAGLRFVPAVPPDLPLLDADGSRLLRLMDNLLENARRHTPAGGTVRLEAAVEGDAVVVRVADTGPGIGADERERIFERYYRGGDARTRGEGTGLGLALARATARAHGGDLTVEETPGGGATFVLMLPLG